MITGEVLFLVPIRKESRGLDREIANSTNLPYSGGTPLESNIQTVSPEEAKIGTRSCS